MPLLTSLSSLLSGEAVDQERIVFQETWDAEASLHAICAFANDSSSQGGGYIVIGASAQDAVPGIPAERAPDILQDIRDKCALIRPGYQPMADTDAYRGKTCIMIWAPAGTRRPYSVPKSLAPGEEEYVRYIRRDGRTVAPSEEELEELRSLAYRIPQEDRTNPSADLFDLNLTLIRSYLREIGSPLYEASAHMDFADLCRCMQLTDLHPDGPRPRNAALLLFHPEPHRFFPYAQIDVVQFPDGLGGDRIIEQIFRGPLQDQLRCALQYIRNCCITEMVVKHPDRAEADRLYNFPYAAVEECLYNAALHKGYEIREPIEVRVLPDQMEIVSHPGPDFSISEEDLQACRAVCKRPRNPRIGDFLRPLRRTGSRGMQAIRKAMEHNGSPRPIIEMDPLRLSFCITLPIHPRFLGR